MLTAVLAIALTSAVVESAPPLVEAENPTLMAMVSTSLWTGQSAFAGGISLERRWGSSAVLGAKVDFQAAQLTAPNQPSQQVLRVDFAPLFQWYVTGHAPSGVWLGGELPMGFLAGSDVGGFTVGGAALLGYSFLFESGLVVRLSAGPSLRYFSQRGAVELKALQAGVGGALALGYAW